MGGKSPSSKGGSRNNKGQFVKGHNSPGPGNPFAGKVQQLRKAIFDQETPEDALAIWAKLKELAKEGDIAAIKEYLDRTVGKAVAYDPDGEQSAEGGVVIEVNVSGDRPVAPDPDAERVVTDGRSHVGNHGWPREVGEGDASRGS
ncbi:MAG: hypothetical protein RIB60_06035 [Phycisphaerales bacterium]